MISAALLLTRLIPIGGFIKKHWGKIAVAVFFSVWAITTISLYNINQNLHEQIGASNTALSVCIASRANMDNELIRLKESIEAIQAANTKYQNDIKEATTRIKGLEDALSLELIEVDRVELPSSCEETMQWMLKKAIK